MKTQIHSILASIIGYQNLHRMLAFIHGLRNVKGWHELHYWKTVKAKERVLSNSHYVYFYTTHFGLDEAFYNGKKVLDIGCGPRGSLEWADMAAERVGLDAIADAYRRLGTANHKMRYVNAPSEQIPFPDKYFDVVCSFNSLDHVDNLDQSISEIIRVLAPGGLFLLLTELNHDPTATEPQVFSWDIVEKFSSEFKLVKEKQYEKSGSGMYDSVLAGVPYNHASKLLRKGILSAKFIKAV